MKQKLLILLVALLGAVSAHAFSYTYEDQTFYYTKTSDTTCKVTSCKANTKNGAYIIPETVTYNTVEYTVTEIAENAFKDYTGLISLVIPESVTIIGQSAFYGCSGLESVNIPENLTEIKTQLFYGCSGLRSLDLPQNINVMEEQAFYGCSSLESLSIPDGIIEIRSQVFYGCSGLGTVDIPDGVLTIWTEAFYGCSSLTSVIIPESVSHIMYRAFGACDSLVAFYGKFSSEDHRCLIKDGELIAFAPNGINSYTIPETVTSVGTGSFLNCKLLSSIVIPSSVLTIGASVFANCSSLSSISIPESVSSIGSNAFYRCSSLTSIVIPNSIETIENSTFRWCSNLSSVVIPESVKTIESHAFWECINLTSITIPGSVTSIGYRAFYGCSGLETINIPDGITTIEGGTFCDCKNLKSVTIPESVTSIQESAFYGCISLTEINIPGTLYTIGENAFYGCSNLKSVTVQESISSIGYGAFQKCTNLESFIIPETLTSIGGWAFNGCGSLNHFVIPESLTNIGDYALPLWGLDSLTVKNPDPSEITLGSYVFSSVDKHHCYLFVPKGSEELYAEADQWKDFVKINYRVLEEGKPYTAEEDAEEPNVDYIRKFGNTKWQALYLPFAMNYDEWSPYADVAELYNIRGYDTDDDGTIDEVRVEFNRLKEGSSIKPNMPYVIKAKETGKVTFECKDKLVLAAPEEEGVVECSSTKFTYAFHGIYEEKTDVFDTGVYFLSGGNFVQAADETVKLAPYRAYLTITQKKGGYNDDSTPAPAPKRIVLVVDGEEETTGIDDIQITAPQDDIYYDLTGRRVTNPTSGIYIQNGRKVYIK